MPTLAPMDTGVHKERNGYERTVLFAEPIGSTLVLFKVDIRVDRIPELSHARVYRWLPGTVPAWHLMHETPPMEFWYDMPSYVRFASDRTARSTWRLALELLEIARSVFRAPV